MDSASKSAKEQKHFDDTDRTSDTSSTSAKEEHLETLDTSSACGNEKPPANDSKQASSVVKMYSPYKLAVPRSPAEFTTPKKPAKGDETESPKKRRIECLQHMLSDTAAQIEANVTSALYNISKGESREATDHLEKARKVLKVQQQTGNRFLGDISSDRCAAMQKIDGLTTRELILHRENRKVLEEKKALKEENEMLKREIICLKAEKSFQNDPDDELLLECMSTKDMSTKDN